MKVELLGASIETGSTNTLANLCVFGVLLFFAVLTAWWAYKDGKARGRNPWLVVLFVLMAGWPISIWWWQWLRPVEVDSKIG